MSWRLVAICDYCGQSQELKARPGNDAEWERELAMEGWWARPDGTDVCPSHPQPVS